ncbi:TPA: tail fiber domain-containing protein [Salmonella enterica subsp. enterica serovar Newport]
MVIEEGTHRLNLPKPNAKNFLQDDVERLRDALEDIGNLAATIAADGKLDPAQIPDSVVQWDANQIIDASHMPGTVVQTDTNGKIPLEKIPQGALVTRFSASTQAEMLALAARPGDICRRTDIPAYYLLMDTPATSVDCWRRLHEDAFYEQFAPYSNPLAGITGALALKAEGQGDYDAATMKQLRSIANTGNAATMSGVMNNFIGAVEWFNGTRLNLPAGYLPADGQELNRADYPDLWAAIDSGLLSFATGGDDAWKATAEWRGQYTKGNGTTTFRMPDLNGVLQNGVNGFTGISSFASPFLRGSGGLGAMGAAQANQNKAHVHKLFMSGGGTGTAVNVIGIDAVGIGTMTNGISQAGNTSVRENMETVGAAEARPNAIVGIWLIRVSGSFNAANTAFNVINKDTAAPNSGTTVSGGKLISSYYVGNVETYRTRLYSQGDFAVSHLAVLAVENMNPDGTITPGNAAYYTFNSNGEFKAPGLVNCNGLTMIGRAAGSPTIILSELDNTSVGIAMRRTNTATAGPRNIVSLRQTSTNTGDVSKAYFHVDGGYICRRGISAAVSNPDNAFNFNWTGGTLETWIDQSNVFNINGGGVIPVSDRVLKCDIRYQSSTRAALAEVLAWRPATFGFKARGVIPASHGHFGFIANDVVRVSPECVTGTGLPEDADLDKIQLKDAYHLDTTAMLAKMTLAFQELEARVKVLEART